MQSRFELAEQSLQAKTFSRRATVLRGCAGRCAHACEGPGHSRSSRRIHCGKLRQRSTGRGKLIQAGDVRGAVRALDEARTIDPVAPGLAEVVAADGRTLQDAGGSGGAGAAAIARVGAGANEPRRRLATSAAAKAFDGRRASTDAERTAAQSPSPPVPPAPAPSPLRSGAVSRRRAKPAAGRTGRSQTGAFTGQSIRRSQTSRRGPREADDDAAIRAVVAAYARAIESKDLALFRSIKPNLGADEERRIQQGFRAVTSQKVNITIVSIDRRGDRATLQLRRQDIIEAGGRRQSPESQQTMTHGQEQRHLGHRQIGR